MGRRRKEAIVVNETTPFIYCPVKETAAEFEKRRMIVQKMIAKFVLQGNKRGRPSLKEEADEEAA